MTLRKDVQFGLTVFLGKRREIIPNEFLPQLVAEIQNLVRQFHFIPRQLYRPRELNRTPLLDRTF
jgi:hypothetical protein